MKLRNFTPHLLRVYNAAGDIILSLPSEGQVRVNEIIESVGQIHGVPVVTKHYGQAELPAYADDEYLVVSRIILEAMPDVPRLLCPDVGRGSAVRDEDGNIIGVRRLQQN